ncbi:MAG: methyltransferase, partial [Ahrensia sp.]|nr:methyltransferase [Ahrensia sp.]
VTYNGQWRNSKIADYSFRRLSTRLPFLKRYSNAKANDLFQITAGFVHSQVLFTCVELGLFELLHQTSHSTNEIAAYLNMSADSARRLLQAAEGLNLICKTKDGDWQLADHGVVLATDHGIKAMVQHHALVYRDLADPIKLLRDPPAQTETSKFWAYVGETPGDKIKSADAVSYSELMRVSQDMVTQEVLDAYDMNGHQSLLDIGGGNGAFIEAAGARANKLQLALFDLPPVAENAKARLAFTKLGNRTTVYGGSFFDDPIPSCADCYSLIRVLYDHNDANAVRLLTNIRKSMKPGNTLIIGEPMAGPTRGAGLVAAYFGFYLLAMRSGRCRSADEISDLLRQAGFTRIATRPTNMPVVAGLVTAQL